MTSPAPAVSIILATYNRPNVLAIAIESVLAQTMGDWELIVVGDCCDDETERVVSSFNDARLRYRNLPVNFGEQSGPNNVGLAEARGRYVAFINHDDLWFPDHLEACTSWLEANCADLVLARGAILWPSADRRSDWRCTVVGAGRDGRYDPAVTVSPASTVLARRSTVSEIGGWRSARECSDESSQDWLFRAWRSGLRLVTMPHLTVVLVPSGLRVNSYLDSAAEEQQLLAKQLNNPDELRLLLLQQATEADVPTPAEYAERQARAARGESPHAATFEGRGYGKGDYIAKLRATRGLPGLPPLERDVASLRALYRERLRAFGPGDRFSFAAHGTGHLVCGEGWSKPEEWGTWSEGQQAELALVLAELPAGPLVLKFVAQGFVPDGQTLRVSIQVNGQTKDEWTFTTRNEQQELHLTIPARLLQDTRRLRITFLIDEPRTPNALGISEDSRLLGLGLQSLELTTVGRASVHAE